MSLLPLLSIRITAFVNNICFEYKFETGSNKASVILFIRDETFTSMHLSDYGGKVISSVNNIGN